MTIKIDLLPKYVGMRRKLKRWIMFYISLVPLLGLVLFLFYYSGQQRLHKIETDLANVKPIADKKVAADTAKAAAEAESGPYKATVDFIVDAGQTGPARAALVDLIRRWIYQKALVSSIDISDGTNVTMTLGVNEPNEYAQFLGILRRASQDNNGVVFLGLPTGSGIPGYGSSGTPTAQPVAGQAPAGPGAVPQPATTPKFPLEITATGVLLNRVVVPVEPVGPPTGAAPGAAGPGGAGPGGAGPGGAGPGAAGR